MGFNTWSEQMLNVIDRKKPSQQHTIEIVDVTPDIASAWLDKNTNNRKLLKRHVARFAEDMSANQWLMTCEPIKFDVAGNLIDGQHRLAACVKAGVPFRTLVAYSLDNAVKNVCDTGHNRTHADVLTMQGTPNASAVATAIKLLINEKRGTPLVGGASAVTNSEFSQALNKHPKIAMYVPQPRVFPRGVSVALVGYVNYVASTMMRRKDRAGAMVQVLRTGVPDYTGDPIHKYRERIVAGYAETVGGVSNRQSSIWTFKHAWNLFADRTPVDRLRWRSEDTAIIGLDLERL